MNRHLLSSADLTRDDVRMLLATASQMHEVQRRDVKKGSITIRSSVRFARMDSTSRPPVS